MSLSSVSINVNRPHLTMKKLAHFGAFDHESYGDILFPKIIESLLPDFAITHVAPTNIGSQWTDACPIISTAEAIQQTDWDGIIVGGGDIIHSGAWSTPKWKKNASFPFGHLPGLWAGAAFLSAKLNIPIAWNAPGVPLPFDPWFSEYAKLALDCTDYIVVRDIPSQQHLQPFTDKPIEVIPDSALILNRLWEINATSDRIVLAISQKDTMLHFKKINATIKKLKAASASGERDIVIAPLMHWEFEGGSQKDLLLQNGIKAPFSMACTSLETTARLIGSSAGYIGNSLHGLVTAASYGVPAVLVIPSLSNTPHKYKGFLDSIGLDATRYTANNWEEACAKLLQQKGIAIGAQPFVALDSHIERIKTLFHSGHIDKSKQWKQLSKKFQTDSENLYLLGTSPEQICYLSQKNEEQIRRLSKEIHALKVPPSLFRKTKLLIASILNH